MNEITGLYRSFRSRGYNFFVGVPCSYLTEFVREMQADPEVRYVPATREDIALGIAVGAYMAGRKPLVYLQSSGLGHLVNLITSLAKPYGVSIHLLISLRSQPFEHEFMYRIARRLLALLEYDDYTIVEERDPETPMVKRQTSIVKRDSTDSTAIDE
ncbi:MAG: sulfopyruvate decarboxylase subunit alpha [Acidobacteria bacterium]|nr:sulfopyruvate decarboxylase subunit alpha [Acidobacteriota bacterium]